MGFFRKVAATVCVGGVGSVAVFQSRRSASTVAPLSAEAFNATQDTALAKRLLVGLARKGARAPAQPADAPPTKVVFFRLLGCPYCARVKAVLDFFHAPYEEVLIDPISGSGFRDQRYPFVPQLMVSAGSTAAGEPLIVDSEEIMKALAAAYSFERDLADMRVGQTRQWLIDRYQKVTFAVLSGSWWNAFQLYPQVVPSWWNVFPARLIGATALYGLSRFKIQPRLAGDTPLENVQKPEWFLKETLCFFDRFEKPSDAFHGGKKPDLADIEMLGVLRAVLDHTETALVLKGDARLTEWLTRMNTAPSA